MQEGFSSVALQRSEQRRTVLPHAQHDSSSSAARKGTADLEKLKSRHVQPRPPTRRASAPRDGQKGKEGLLLPVQLTAVPTGLHRRTSSDNFSLENNLEMSNVCRRFFKKRADVFMNEGTIIIIIIK